MLTPLLLDNLLSSGTPITPPVIAPPQQLFQPTTALDIIYGALRVANILAAGETPSPADSRDALNTLNDLLDSLSADKDFIYVSQENVFNWIPGQYQYTIGNPIGGTFSGTLSAGSPIIGNVLAPANLTENAILTDVQGAIPAGTTILPGGLGIGQITMSTPALISVNQPETIQYTIPGDIPIARPLRISSGYTRIPSSTSALDYWFDTTLTLERYNEIGFKGVPGPWPLALAYQTTFPLGTIWIYPMPTSAYEVHLFTDLILSQFTSVTQAVNLPQGYNRALKRLLGLELCPEYGKTPSLELKRQASEARAFIKSLNASPVTTLRYDSALLNMNRRNDASWITDGGFNR